MFCQTCGTEVQAGNFCPKCGSNISQNGILPAPYAPNQSQYAAPYPWYGYPPSTSNQAGPERSWAIASVVLGIASFIVLPIIFTPAGVIFGAVSLSKKSSGNKLAYLGIVLSILGIITSVVVNAILLY